MPKGRSSSILFATAVKLTDTLRKLVFRGGSQRLYVLHVTSLAPQNLKAVRFHSSFLPGISTIGKSNQIQVLAPRYAVP